MINWFICWLIDWLGDKPGKKPKKMIRMAGGQMWEDPSLLNWDPNDYRSWVHIISSDTIPNVDDLIVRAEISPVVIVNNLMYDVKL